MQALPATVPVNWRASVKTMLFAAMRKAGADRRSSDAIRDAYADYMDRGPGR